MSPTPSPPDEVARRFDAAQASLKATANGTTPGLNPYAHDKRVLVGHRIYSSLSERLARLSQELEQAGWASRQVSQAELLQMTLHFGLPETAEDAAPMVQAWNNVKAAPGPKP